MNYMHHSSQTQFEGRGAAKNMPNVTDDPMCSENPPLFVALERAFRDACERAPAYPSRLTKTLSPFFVMACLFVRLPHGGCDIDEN